MTWQVRTSDKMLVLGTILLIAGFALIAFFLNLLAPFSNRLTLWLCALLIMPFFGLGLFSILAVKLKEIATAFMIIFLWSLVFLVPVPEGYEEIYYGGSLSLLGGIMVLYVKYKDSKKKAQL